MNDTFKELDGQELDQISGGLKLPLPLPRPWPIPCFPWPRRPIWM